MYFDNLLITISTNKDQLTLLRKMINPLSPYILCNHYVSEEAHRIVPKELRFGKTDLLRNKNYDNIKEGDIVQCEFRLVEYFVTEVLEKINVKFVLITSQMDFPPLYQNELTDKLLANQKIILWISQNPLYENSDRYMAFPFGMKPCNLEKYADTLLNKNINKKRNIGHLPFRITHECRTKLPKFEKKQSIELFYNKTKIHKYLLSPIGDRDDCYRHYECIGLETIPISNVNSFYKNIFGNSMYYTDIDTMVNILNTNTIDHEYTTPNKDLICFDYWKNTVNEKILEINLLNRV